VLRASAPLPDGAGAQDAAQEVGFPLFVKASAGGGGRGLRLVKDAGALAAAVDSASREAAAAFGDGTVFLEQAVTSPRHIEVQVLADATGDAVHLFERDCSVQRRTRRWSSSRRRRACARTPATPCAQRPSTSPAASTT
jgi:pyruvate carboxylase